VTFIRPKFWIDADSSWDLDTAAFDLDNTPQGSTHLNPNFLITPDVPKGVLGGMVASQAGDWTDTNGRYNRVPLGLFNQNSEGNPYQNNPAVGSGKVGIYMYGATLLLYMFETHHSAQQAGNWVALNFPTDYATGVLLYCSPYSLLTPDQPSAFNSSDGINYAIAVVAKTPTTVDQELGIKMLI
jgi:hypothetical protein